MQTDNDKQRFLVHYLKTDGENVFLQYKSIRCIDYSNYSKSSSLTEFEKNFQDQVTLFQGMTGDFYGSRAAEDQSLPQYDLIIPEQNNNAPIHHMFFNQDIILYQNIYERQSINIIQQK